MTGYVVRRLIASVVLLLGVTFVTFVLFFQIPEHPEYMLAGAPHPYGTKEQDLRYQRALVAARHQLGVDQPLYVQYGRYLDRLAHGSMGTSFSQRPVTDLLWPAAQITAWLVAGGMLLLLLIAIPLGLVAGLHAGRFLARAILPVTLLGVSIPVFIIAYTMYSGLEPKIGFPQLQRHFDPPIPAPAAGYCPIFGGTSDCG